MIKSSVCACLPTVSPESLDLTPDLAYDPRRALTLTFATPSSSSPGSSLFIIQFTHSNASSTNVRECTFGKASHFE